jgi:hypothetical protein
MWKKVGMVLGILLILFISDFFLSWSRMVVWVSGDALAWKSAYLAGLRGVNCGRVGIRQRSTEATNCALKANAEGKPFRVAYSVMGYDSTVAGAIVRTPSGKVWALSFDGDPAGQGGTNLFRQRVNQKACPEPVHLWVNPSGRINCFTQESAPPHDIMSPNAEPY